MMLIPSRAESTTFRWSRERVTGKGELGLAEEGGGTRLARSRGRSITRGGSECSLSFFLGSWRQDGCYQNS